MKREFKFRAWDNGPDQRMINQKDYSGDLHSFFYMCQDVLKGHELIYMQFVGIQDIHNKDVYEGDRTVDGVIEFNIDTCCYIIRRVNGTFIRLDVRKKNLEIVGNIYEQPF